MPIVDGETETTNAFTLSEFMRQTNLNDDEIGILSIDIENKTTPVLIEFLNFISTTPQILVVEANDTSEFERQKLWIESVRPEYKLAGGVLPNYFYVRKDLLNERS